MKEFKGTKAPWTVWSYPSGLVEVKGNNDVIVASASLGRESYTLDREITLNAHLIAAAPELLSALQILINCYDQEPCAVAALTAINNARYVVNKALGETQ